MRTHRLLVVSTLVAAGLLAGCATPPPPNPTAEVPYCHKTNKGRIIACTKAPVPSLDADAAAKRFTPDPDALTVYAVQRYWAEGSNVLTVHGGSAAIRRFVVSRDPVSAQSPCVRAFSEISRFRAIAVGT
jgi:hypothetical protein